MTLKGSRKDGISRAAKHRRVQGVVKIDKKGSAKPRTRIATALLLFAETTLALAGQECGVLSQQGVLSLQALCGHLLPQRGHGGVGRTQLQAPVQRLAPEVGGAHPMSLDAVGGGRREGEEGC
ncbi:hypothetical protein EYF80_038735 [Liparis tanakae]|uniref:Uncharacterized protein n=1 Tax=Liparis tanakae TaxID=230148 RepID=A0A4Z2GEA6_9TELE|nr:hypothetical protein EYF80_038735 [Liparis tanakae]